MNSDDQANVDGDRNGRREALEWAQTIARLLKSIDAHHAGITTARKREGLTRALLVREPDSVGLMHKINRLVDSWTLSGAAADRIDVTATTPFTPLDTSTPARRPTDTAANAGTLSITPSVTQTIARTTDTTILGLEARAAAHDSMIAEKLRDLLALMLRNIAELTPEHQMLEQQVDQINAILSLPLNEKRIGEAERQLRSLMIKQGAIKHSIEEAKAAIKEMVATLIARLSAASDTAGGYYEKVEAYANHIRSAENIGELSQIVRGLLDDTRVVSVNMARARDDLVYARQKVREHEQRVETLERELARVSQLIRTDPLTETLNRRGFEETYAAEYARALRSGDVLTVAMLDVDDFKLINDRYGHQAGDTALKHLSEVLRETLRPTDAIARYGGEEFAILLPGVSLSDAAAVMTRVQRELTRRIFMHNYDKILMTFSAGVAQVDLQSGLADALERADRAMYEAKRTGKNRVRVADQLSASL
jgi:diguanylate cyclase